MSRCKSCDVPLLGKYRVSVNPHTGQEDDLCSECARASTIDYEEPEYVGGLNPRDGITPSRGAGYE